jgi:hypothetical protein
VQRGAGATRPTTDNWNLNRARQIVYKMLACRPGSEYGFRQLQREATVEEHVAQETKNI